MWGLGLRGLGFGVWGFMALGFWRFGAWFHELHRVGGLGLGGFGFGPQGFWPSIRKDRIRRFWGSTRARLGFYSGFRVQVSGAQGLRV